MQPHRGFLALSLAASVSGTALAATKGEITVVLPEQPANLEPCRSIRNDIGRIINMNITETLTDIQAEEGTVTPFLATSWEQVDDLTWRFKLRDGVKFQDGTDFNADAVVHTVNRLMNRNLTCDSRSKFGDIKLTPKAVDPQTVEIKSDIPIPILPTLMGTVQIVSPKLPLDKETNKPVGTGPYKLDSASPERVVLTWFDGYWGKPAEVKKTTFVWRPEFGHPRRHGLDRRSRSDADHRGSGRDRPGDRLRLSEFRDDAHADRRADAAARRQAGPRSAQPRHRLGRARHRPVR